MMGRCSDTLWVSPGVSISRAWTLSSVCALCLGELRSELHHSSTMMSTEGLKLGKGWFCGRSYPGTGASRNSGWFNHSLYSHWTVLILSPGRRLLFLQDRSPILWSLRVLYVCCCWHFGFYSFCFYCYFVRSPAFPILCKVVSPSFLHSIHLLYPQPVFFGKWYFPC